MHRCSNAPFIFRNDKLARSNWICWTMAFLNTPHFQVWSCDVIWVTRSNSSTCKRCFPFPWFHSISPRFLNHFDLFSFSPVDWREKVATFVDNILGEIDVCYRMLHGGLCSVNSSKIYKLIRKPMTWWFIMNTLTNWWDHTKYLLPQYDSK